MAVSLVSPVFAAYNEPAAPYPNIGTTDIPTVLNSSSQAQRKTGSLMIGTTTGDPTFYKKLCLNPAIHTSTGVLINPSDSDPAFGYQTSCITSWDDLASVLIDSTLFARKLYQPTHVEAPDWTDTIDNGYISLQALNLNLADLTKAQIITLMLEANPTSTATPPFPATAIQGDGVTDASYAATFAGRLGVFPNGPIPAKLCLNDLAVGGTAADCITQWSSTNDTALVRLQNLRGFVTSAVPDPGNTALGGALVARSIVAGGPVFGTNIVNSCGDGICSLVNETDITCSMDCQ